MVLGTSHTFDSVSALVITFITTRQEGKAGQNLKEVEFDTSFL